MYEIKNGILEKNGKKVFALGESYYPSFHPAKYPVPPEGDRIGEMKKDFSMMKEMGFNHIRIAAIGIIKLADDGKIVIDTPFVDEMLKEAEKLDISISIRLQGFSVNLRNFKDVLMIDANGVPQDTTVWYDFIQTTMNHEGILEDNRTYAKTLAEYYEKSSSVVGYQIYNEPHFPGAGKKIYDYHPSAIEAYRKWLVNGGYMDEKEAKNYNPPKAKGEQSPEMWALWRKFSQLSLANFLNNAADAAKEGSKLPTFTCYTPCQLGSSNPLRGVDIFENARSDMDIVGYTCYYHAVGAEYYPFCHYVDLLTSAAMYEGKEAWCIELDSRTYIPPELFNKNTYATLGAGVKGIVYYQWRGDHPSPATPIPNGCGLVNYDGSKTKNFENADKMVKFINRMSDYLTDAKRSDERIAVLHSDYAMYTCDATENTDKMLGDDELVNSCLNIYQNMYKQLREKNYMVNVVDEKTLKKNSDRIDFLFVPNRIYLSDGEKAAIEEFIANGGSAFEPSYGHGGYMPYGTEKEVYTTYYTIDELCCEILPEPKVKANNPLVGVQSLEGDGYTAIMLTNLSIKNKAQKLELDCNFDFNKATLCTTDGDKNLEVCGNKIVIDGLGDGGIVIIEHAC